MNNARTIGHRDLEFYLACAEQEQTALRRCAPELELTYVKRRNAALAVVAALEAYNALTHA